MGVEDVTGMGIGQLLRRCVSIGVRDRVLIEMDFLGPGDARRARLEVGVHRERGG